MTSSSELSVTGITVESLYNNYSANKYRINRRYQRKLVWSSEDKENLVDSIFRNYPIPLLLFADIKDSSDRYYEVIDGMQRINAIIYFVENRISFNGKYFDLDSLSATKAQLDAGELKQKEPKLSRNECLKFTSYIIPSSTYEFDAPQQVDEVFKRINSMGRYLSRQELRVAGALGDFSTLVRKIAANIRGDSSQSDTFPLDKMPFISLAFGENEPGIQVQDIFWIKHGVITKEWLRESRDEEVVCDIVASVALKDMPPSNSDVFNDFYGFPESTDRSSEVNAAVSRVSASVIEQRVLSSLDEIKKIFATLNSTFIAHCFSEPPARAPRYFTALFLAVYYLNYEKSRVIVDYIGLGTALKYVCDNMQVGTGGNWSAASKERNRDMFVGIIDRFCGDRGKDDPAASNWTTKIENILNQSLIEQQLYDFKIGFTDLVSSAGLNQKIIPKIVETLTAMSNLGPGKVCYVVVGVADKKEDANRVLELYGIDSSEKFGRHIVGIAHDCEALGVNEDSLFSRICSEVETLPVDVDVKRDIKSNIKLVTYNGKSLVVFQLQSGNAPRLFDSKYYIRDGASNRLLEMKDVQWLFSKFVTD